MKKREISRLVNSLKDFMKKRGLSQVIGMLILVLLTVVAISFIWVLVSTLLSRQSDIAEAQTKFFSIELNLVKVKFDSNDNLKLDLSLSTSSGSFNINSSNVTSQPFETDVISVEDVSGSMRECVGTSVTSTCCSTVLHGVYSASNPPYCHSIPLAYVGGCVPQCGGTLQDGLTASQDANKQLVSTIFQNPQDNNRIGLSTYNTTLVTSFSSALTNSNSTLTSIINSWQARGNTCICCGINDARNKLSSSSASIQKTIIVMSDGDANVACGGANAKQDAINAACNAYAAIPNLTIYAVGLGAVDASTMQAIAQCGNGSYFSASQVGDLVDVYDSLANYILQRSTAVNKLNYLKVIFYDSVGKTVQRTVDVPPPLDTLTYNLNLNGAGLTAPIIKIEVYPVVSSGKGKEIIGPLIASWERT